MRGDRFEEVEIVSLHSAHPLQPAGDFKSSRRAFEIFVAALKGTPRVLCKTFFNDNPFSLPEKVSVP